MMKCYSYGFVGYGAISLSTHRCNVRQHSLVKIVACHKVYLYARVSHQPMFSTKSLHLPILKLVQAVARSGFWPSSSIKRNLYVSYQACMFDLLMLVPTPSDGIFLAGSPHSTGRRIARCNDCRDAWSQSSNSSSGSNECIEDHFAELKRKGDKELVLKARKGSKDEEEKREREREKVCESDKAAWIKANWSPFARVFYVCACVF